ncbi:MAG: Lrp/AsnC family transcriptional regulator [Bryobacterales bacterium]|jgi:Lrp/AsnC family leucine-responsive transcriptional regulator|nr:Lrp/AsnC family transcriptional regulator [Bryobacterales bacterium]
MDAIDSKVLFCLSHDGRISWTDLAQQLGLSAPAAADRVRKLEEAGIIRGYTAIVPPPAMGLQLSAFVAITFGKSKHRKPFLKAIQRIPEVLECHHVAGEEDFLLKVVARDTAHLDHLVGEQLRSLSGVLRTRTTVVLSTQKEGSFRPSPPSGEAPMDERGATHG